VSVLKSCLLRFNRVTFDCDSSETRTTHGRTTGKLAPAGTEGPFVNRQRKKKETLQFDSRSSLRAHQSANLPLCTGKKTRSGDGTYHWKTSLKLKVGSFTKVRTFRCEKLYRTTGEYSRSRELARVVQKTDGSGKRKERLPTQACHLSLFQMA
jgi:hypothetical protein